MIKQVIESTRIFILLVLKRSGYEKLTFGEKGCRNYLDKARLLRLGMGTSKPVVTILLKYKQRILASSVSWPLTRTTDYEMCFGWMLQVGQCTNHLGMLLPLTWRTWRQASTTCLLHNLEGLIIMGVRFCWGMVCYQMRIFKHLCDYLNFGFLVYQKFLLTLS